MSARRICFIHTAPEAVRRAFRNMEAPSCPEEHLFQEIVARAVLDALGHTGLNDAAQHNQAVREARVWFKFGENTQLYCDMAGLDLEVIRSPLLATLPWYKYEPEGENDGAD